MQWRGWLSLGYFLADVSFSTVIWKIKCSGEVSFIPLLPAKMSIQNYKCPIKRTGILSTGILRILENLLKYLHIPRNIFFLNQLPVLNERNSHPRKNNLSCWLFSVSAIIHGVFPIDKRHTYWNSRWHVFLSFSFLLSVIIPLITE